MVTTVSASRTASRAARAIVTPVAAAAVFAASTRSKPETAWPALTRLAAIGAPMLPRPMNATFDMSASLGRSILDQAARHDDPHDLVRSFEDLVHAKVAHQFLDPVVGEIAITAEQLQRVVGRVEAGVGGCLLGHGAEAGRFGRMLVERARRPPEHRTRRLERSRDIRDPELQRLKVGDAAAERLALAHIGDRFVERRLPAADRTGTDVEPAAVEPGHCDFEAAPLDADQIARRNPHALEDHLAGRLR